MNAKNILISVVVLAITCFVVYLLAKPKRPTVNYIPVTKTPSAGIGSVLTGVGDLFSGLYGKGNKQTTAPQTT